MSTKKKPAKSSTPDIPAIAITNCNITSNNSTAANEHTRAAIEALARASERHAEALIAIANALKGGDINTSGHGMFIAPTTCNG
mgnify:CR=1 FL=1